MMLKIERYNKDQMWWMYDNIRKVSVSNFYGRSVGTDPNEGEYDLILFDIDNKKEDVPYRIIRCALKDGSEMSIAFDTIAYLLNDNGKTIEKIVANYND